MARLGSVLALLLILCGPGCDEEPVDDDSGATDDDSSEPNQPPVLDPFEDLEVAEGTALLTVGRVPMITTFAGSPGGAGLADGIGTDAYFFHPYGIIYHEGMIYISDGSGHTIRSYDPATGMLYIAEHNGHVIRQFDTVTREMTTLSGDHELMAPIDGLLDEATYSTPVDILVVDDYLLVLDRYSAHIRKVELP